MSQRLTFAKAEAGGVAGQQQGVIEEALEHGRLHAGLGQVLAAHCRATNHQGQRLAHGDGLQETPGESPTVMSCYGTDFDIKRGRETPTLTICSRFEMPKLQKIYLLL